MKPYQIENSTGLEFTVQKPKCKEQGVEEIAFLIETENDETPAIAYISKEEAIKLAKILIEMAK